MKTTKNIQLKNGLAVALALSSSVAQAGTGNGTIKSVTVLPAYNLAFFSLVPGQTPNPTCNTTLRFTFSVSTPSGQAALALVMTAYSLGKNVYVAGTGVCDLWADAETMSHLTSP